ncbi:hypothetical protein L2E82_49399 [Cichorium intybus]|uniref:Uncharacterized protein n=1 Tax=Cichorium intybus TaxID=13427 RepID=A0ACB8Z4N2_CICIN|nr:hypothetical protein L2E82_49399 [Cichorium intybus]
MEAHYTHRRNRETPVEKIHARNGYRDYRTFADVARHAAGPPPSRSSPTTPSSPPSPPPPPPPPPPPTEIPIRKNFLIDEYGRDILNEEGIRNNIEPASGEHNNDPVNGKEGNDVEVEEGEFIRDVEKKYEDGGDASLPNMESPDNSVPKL